MGQSVDPRLPDREITVRLTSGAEMVGFLSLPGRFQLAGFLRLLSVELVLRYIHFFALTRPLSQVVSTGGVA